MKDIENECTPEMIISLREEALNKMATLMKDENNIEDAELEKQI